MIKSNYSTNFFLHLNFTQTYETYFIQTTPQSSSQTSVRIHRTTVTKYVQGLHLSKIPVEVSVHVMKRQYVRLLMCVSATLLIAKTGISVAPQKKTEAWNGRTVMRASISETSNVTECRTCCEEGDFRYGSRLWHKFEWLLYKLSLM